MNALILSSIILGCAAQDLLRKVFANKRGSHGAFFYAAISTFFALLFFAAGGIGRGPLGLLPYALAFGLSYGVAGFCAVWAVGCGPLSLTSLMISYSLMLPTLYGLIFLKDPMGKGFIAGLLLLVLSLWLVSKKDEKVEFSFRWVILTFFAFLGNGGCSIFQKMQQVAFEGDYKNELMVLALGIALPILLGIALISEKGEWKENFKAGTLPAALAGLANGVVNLLVMILSGRMAVSVMFPLISAGGLMVVFFISRFIFKENLTKRQMLGFFFGMGSIVLLSI